MGRRTKTFRMKQRKMPSQSKLLKESRIQEALGIGEEFKESVMRKYFNSNRDPNPEGLKRYFTGLSWINLKELINLNIIKVTGPVSRLNTTDVLVNFVKAHAKFNIKVDGYYKRHAGAKPRGTVTLTRLRYKGLPSVNFCTDLLELMMNNQLGVAKLVTKAKQVEIVIEEQNMSF